MKRVLFSILFLAAFVAATAAQASSCLVILEYPTINPVAKNTAGSVMPSVTLHGDAEIDNFHTYSLVSVSGPTGGNLNATISARTGRVSFNADKTGSYTVTVSVQWDCSGGGFTSDTDHLFVSIC